MQDCLIWLFIYLLYLIPFLLASYYFATHFKEAD